MGGYSERCQVCDKWFTQRGKLKQHQRDAHNLGGHKGADGPTQEYGAGFTRYQTLPRDDWRKGREREELLPVNKADWVCAEPECSDVGCCPWPCPLRVPPEQYPDWRRNV